MQAPTVSSRTLAHSLAPRFGAGAVATPRAVRASAAGPRLGARRFQAVDRRRPTAVSTRRLPFLGGAAPPPAGSRPSRAAAPARRASHVARAASRQLSEFPVADRRAELSGMKMAQLKPLCKGSGLRQGGKKSELIDRLLEHEFGTTDDEADIDPRDDIVGLANEWRSGRAVSGGVSFGEMDRVESALSSSGFVDERAADAAFYEQGFDDGGYAQSSEARGDQNAFGAPSAAARVLGRDGRGFDDGGGSGWGRDDDDSWYADEDTRLGGDVSERGANVVKELTAEEKAEAQRRARNKAERSLERRAAIVAALRTLATEREGFESDPRVHLEAVSRAIERAYRNMRYSAFAKMDDRSRDVCVDINVATGTLAILAQRVGRAGTVEWEVDDTEAFLEAHSKRHQIRKLAYAFTEEINEAVSAAAAESYVARDGEMVEATVVAEGQNGEILLKLDDGAYACLPPEEGIPDKRYAQGDKICALVIGVEPRTWAADKRAPVIVSCGIAGLLAEVLKAEVPEVADGRVVIKGVSRVSGKMAKVAVAAKAGEDADFDPVLVCVGAENARLRAIRERLGGEVCQILPWREDPEAFVAEALFPAVIQRVTQMDAAGSLDERGNVRRMSKFVAYVNRFDEAKAIGAGGMNVKLAAALCGCFIMVERHEETAFEKFASRGGDTRAEERWAEDDADRWSDAREDDDWLSSPDEALSSRANDAEMRAPIDLEDDGLDELGWPDLDVEGISGVGPSALYDPRSDEANWEEVGPGKVGVVTFGGNLGAGIAGGCSFMGDPEDAEAERLGDAAEAAMASGAGAAFQPSQENDESSPIGAPFFSDDADDADDADLFADDDLFGEDWNR